MAKATVECKCKTCGKIFTKWTYKNSRREADEWEAWAAENIDECPECYNARIKAEKLAEADEMIGDVELVNLTGSEKQIKWANDIRSQKLAEVLKVYGTSKEFLDVLYPLVNKKSESKFWIDNRFASVAELLNKIDD